MIEYTSAARTAALDELAIFGGDPRFSEPLHVGRPNLAKRELILDRVGEALDRGWLTNDGPLVKEFELRIAELVGVEHCVALSSGTVGLQMAAMALGLSGKVIVPSFTFVATVHALMWTGLEPVFCDVDRRTHTMDPEAVAALIAPHTSGILGVHLWGHPCDVERLTQIALEHEIPLLFDAAHAFGCSLGRRMIGGFGDAEVFSFHATKFISSAEGGAVTTNDRELADRLRLMRNFGFVGYDAVAHPGTNGKMSELSAAMGLASLDSMDEFVAVNRRNYERYVDGLDEIPGLSLMSYDEAERNNYQYVVLELTGPAGHRWRDALVAVLHAENVLARRYFHPGCHRLEVYAEGGGSARGPLPVTEDIAGRLVTLPTGSWVDESAIDGICSIIRVAAEHAEELHRRLGPGDHVESGGDGQH